MKRIFDHLKVVDFVTLIYQVLVIVLVLINFSKITIAWKILFIHLAIILFVFSIRRYCESENRVLTFLNLWLPYICIPINFSQLPHIIPELYIEDIDGILIQLDYAIFSVHPTVWMEKVHWPPVTEFLQLIYITFYFLPVILIYRLYKRGEYKELYYFQFVFFLGFYISYIGYFSFPSIGPRFTLQHYQSFPLEGVFLTRFIQNLLNNLEQINRDAFPSGHTMMTMLSMIFAYKFDRKLAKSYTFITVCMIISTVYLRYHYVVDVIGGVILVLLTVYLAKIIYPKSLFSHK